MGLAVRKWGGRAGWGKRMSLRNLVPTSGALLWLLAWGLEGLLSEPLGGWKRPKSCYVSCEEPQSPSSVPCPIPAPQRGNLSPSEGRDARRSDLLFYSIMPVSRETNYGALLY